MSERDDGGPAFPRSGTDGPEGYPGVSEQSGMTLRDWFAGQAMNGFASDPSSHDLFDDKDDMARNAYEVADAMIKEREK